MGGCRKIWIIPHHSKASYYKEKYDNFFDTNTRDWKSFSAEIVSSEKVIGSSLHEIIVAESYGIPAVLLDDILGDDFFKYEDYYLSTGQSNFPRAKTVEEGYIIAGEINPNLSIMQKKLLDSFPIEYF